MPSMLFAEDLTVGTVFPLGRRTLTAAEIVDFARRWDPQTFHVDEAVATASSFGGLIACGVHTIAVAQRLLADAFLTRTAVIAGLGVDDLRLLAPVRPGTVITGTAEITACRPRDDGRAVVTFATALVDEAGAPLMAQRTTMLVHGRPPD
jgi:acyl dehydratase